MQQGVLPVDLTVCGVGVCFGLFGLLGKATRAQLQGCVKSCKCGDKGCLGGCALEIPSSKALASMKCIEAKRPAGYEGSVSAELQTLPEFSTASCPSSCQCVGVGVCFGLVGLLGRCDVRPAEGLRGVLQVW